MSEKRFLVTARKYRPQLFSELVAQEHVTETLKNAIRLDRLAHAYMFTGPRGVGKTTAARILAKAINCTRPAEERTDRAEPCRECDSCRSFEEGRNLNIIEIDAASNNKVDDIRELRETVRIPPQGNRKKVYIVDEVHMLTNQAFNALLKTLEEPPPHVLFIFATTEPHKVLPTIQSRCQRFDFRRIAVQEIVAHLKDICEAENVSSDEGSLMLIARKGDGALRDALSVFDQAVSLCGESLSLHTLVDALGVVGEELFFDVTTHVAAGDVAGMLATVDGVVANGYDLQEFLDGLAEHLRNILVARTMPDASLIEASEATRERYLDVAKHFTETDILRLLAGVDRTLDGLRVARQPRLRLELALIRMASMPSAVDLGEALSRIDALLPEAVERPSPAAPAPKPSPRASQMKAPAPSRTGSATDPKPVVAAASKHSTPSRKPEPEPANEPEPEPANEPEPEPEPAAERPLEPASDPEPAPNPNQGALFASGSGGMEVFGKPALGIPPIADTASEPTGAHHSTATLVAPTSETGRRPEAWDAVVTHVTENKIHLGALLQHAEPAIREESVLTLIVPDDFHAGVLKDAIPDILEGMAEATYPVTTVEFEVNGRAAAESEADGEAVNPQEALLKLCEEYPAIQKLMERFGGEIVW